MIKKLQKKFIFATLFSLLTVLFIIIGGINVINYCNVIENSNNIINILAKNNGKFPKHENVAKDINKLMSPEIPYESRYFSVLFSRDTKVLRVDTGKVVAINSDKAVEYAKKALNSNKSEDFIRNYRYRIVENNENILIIFLDCTRNLETFKSFLFTSIFISVLGLISVLILIIILSKRILKPVIESNEKQKQFITDAGHEIKTPLAIIQADVDVLEIEIGENQWISDINTQINRLSKLTKNLIYLSRMEEEQDKLEKLEFSLSDVLEESCHSFETLAQSQNKHISYNISPMISLYGNENSISQLISILLDNAIKYSPEYETINVYLNKKNKNISLCISNKTLEKIEQKQLNLLFDRFYRTDLSRNSNTGGYGIGLSIAQVIVNAHKGKIYAKLSDNNTISFIVNFSII